MLWRCNGRRKGFEVLNGDSEEELIPGLINMPVTKNYNGFKLEIDEIAVLTFNQPKVNIFSPSVLNDFVKAIKNLYSSKTLKVLVITAKGSTFLAGADIKEMSSFTPEDARKFSQLFHKAMGLVEEFPLPVIAGVNGYALGGGCELTLVCDIVIASDRAVFSQPEINLGIIPGAGGTQRLKKRIGENRAKELIFTGRRVLAEEALGMGLVNKVCPSEKLYDEVMGLAGLITSKPVHCLAACKRLINSGSLREEIEDFKRMFSYEEQKRLMDGFLKKKG